MSFNRGLVYEKSGSWIHLIMTKHRSNNNPVRSADKGPISSHPSDDRHVIGVFDSIPLYLGKYVSAKGSCVIFHQNDISSKTTMTSELLILRFKDSIYESQLECAQKCEIDYREEITGHFKISGQFDDMGRLKHIIKLLLL